MSSSSSRPQFTFTPFNAYPTTPSAPSGSQTPRPTSPGSPPPYSVTPPELDPNSPFLAKRSASSPHLQSPPSSPGGPFQPYVYNNNDNAFRRPSSSTHLTHRSRHPYAQTDTSDDQDTDTSPEDTIIYTSTHPTLAGTLRAHLLGTATPKCQNRDQVESDRIRPITTAPGLIGAGETETEGEDSPRHLPTARLTPSTNHIHLPFFTSLTSSSSLFLTHIPSPRRTLLPTLFEMSRLLSIVPAMFGMVYNLYFVWRPPGSVEGWGRGGKGWWRVEYFVCVLWAILTGWQCLQLTTGLLKRWRVYYTSLPTLIRLLALQAICWPATHLTLTILEHEKRPLVCWAVIGTTTCCSRSVQMWVTSNIIVTHPVGGSYGHHHHQQQQHYFSPLAPSPLAPSPLPPSGATLSRDPTSTIPPNFPDSNSNLNPSPNVNVGKERMRMGKRRKWDWGAVGRECVIPAGVIYFVMAWVGVLRWEVAVGGELGKCVG